MDEKNLLSNVVTVKTETALPAGKIISYQGDELAIPEKSRKDLIAWDISIGDNKLLWVLSVKSAFNDVQFMQLIKNAQNLGYKIVKKALIEPNVLNALYDRRATSDVQKATSTDSVVIAAFELIIAHALSENISDVHIEVRNNGGVIRMRKNGEMMEYRANSRMTYNEASSLCSVIYTVLASTKAVSFDPRECQQGAVNYSIKDQELKLRYQSVPAYPDGFDVILRVLPVGRSEDFVPLQKLGYTEQQVEELNSITSRPVGSLIIAGVTGSGKSTTLKNLLMYVNVTTGYKLKIYTIEDPPEYNIARVTQIPVVIGKDFDPTKMSPFEKPIKACMRGDPDIIMVGEVRDKVTGDLTKKAVQSGHQVLTTVHATSAVGIIDRFVDFGLTRSVLGSPDFLTGLLYQKLLGTVCHHCAIDFNELIHSENITKKDLDVYTRIGKVTDPSKYKIRKRNEAGCQHCNYSGLKGRSVCAEVITIDLEMIQLIADGKTLEFIKHWRSLSDQDPFSENMRGKICMEHAFQKMLAGTVCPYDVEASFKPIDEMLMPKPKTKALKEDLLKDVNEQSSLENKDGWGNL